MDVGGFGQWKGRTLAKGNGKNPIGKGKGTGKRWCEIIGTSRHAENSRSVLDLREKQAINRRTAGQGHCSTIKDSEILLEREMV